MGDWEDHCTTETDRRCSTDPNDRDFPGAVGFIRLPNSKISRRPNGRRILYIVIHITGGPATNEGPAINTFRNANVGGSAHYIVNRQGQIFQAVRDRDIAAHVNNLGSQFNAESIGIEHVNRWNRNHRESPTRTQYRASAQLVRWLCQKYAIPKRHTPGREPGIKGHSEANPNARHSTCPNPAWAWDHYMGLVAPQLISLEPGMLRMP